ncbi:AMP-binding protein [Cupriavidus basilensis]
MSLRPRRPAWARALQRWGLRPGDRVAAFGKNSDAYVLLWLAAWRAGG